MYLNDLARKILKTVPPNRCSVWVFPKSLMGDHKHVGRRLAQRTRANIITDTKEGPHGRDAVDVRGHDLRRTAASLMAGDGVLRFVISRILNHSEETDITSVYDRYDVEKTAAMEFWNRQLAAISRRAPSTVARFAMSRR